MFRRRGGKGRVHCKEAFGLGDESILGCDRIQKILLVQQAGCIGGVRLQSTEFQHSVDARQTGINY